MKELIETVKRLRLHKGLSTRVLAEMVGVSQSYLSHLENGRREKPPTPEVIKKLAAALDYDYFSMMRMAGFMEVGEVSEEEEEETPNLSPNPDSILKNLPRTFKDNFFISQGLKAEEVSQKSDEEVDAMFEKAFPAFGTAGSWAKAIRVTENESIESLSAKTNIPESELTAFEEDNKLLSVNQLLSIGNYLGIGDFHRWFESNTNVLSSSESILSFIQENDKKGRKQRVYFDAPLTETLEVYNKSTQVVRAIPNEEAKQRFLYLENLLTMDENIFLNEKVLTRKEKNRALKILKLVFETDSNKKE